MKKRILSLVLTFSILLSALPLNVLTVFAGNNILYGDADGNGKVELLDVNLMERYIEGDEDAKADIHFTEADVNADGAVDDTDVQMVKDYLVGNLDSLTPTLHTISFETAGGGDFAPVKAGDGYPYRGELPTPAKDDYVFVNWTMENGETYYPLTEVVSADMTLTAVYEPVESKEQLNITSFSLDNQKPDVSFAVTGLSSIDDVKANITVLPKDGSDPVPVDVSDNGDGTFTVYAPDGFNAGASYELTLGDGLTWMYPKKVDKCVRIRDKKKQKGKTHMPNKNSPTKYSEEFKKTIVTLYQSGKTYAEIKKEYGVSSSALSNWVRKYSQVQVDEDTVLTAQQIKALQRRNAELEEENLILKKAIAIFTPHSDRD